MQRQRDEAYRSSAAAKTRLPATQQAETLLRRIRIEDGLPPEAEVLDLDGSELFMADGCPSLPREARFDLAEGRHAGQWIDIYTRYAQGISPMTPILFHQSAALWLVAVAIARRLKINLGLGDIYPNLFLMWLAPTTLYRKSTALDVARITAYKTMSHLLLPQDTTPEALLAELAGQSPEFLDDLPQTDQKTFYAGRDYAGQKGFILDEPIARQVGIDHVLAEVLPDGKVAEVQALQERFGLVWLSGAACGPPP